MVFQQRRRRFRAVLAGDTCLHPASVFDALSARIAEEAAKAAASSETANSTATADAATASAATAAPDPAEQGA